MSTSVKLGIVGTGNMGTSHGRKIVEGKIPRLELVAVCDRDPARLASFPKVKVFVDAIGQFVKGPAPDAGGGIMIWDDDLVPLLERLKPLGLVEYLAEIDAILAAVRAAGVEGMTPGEFDAAFRNRFMTDVWCREEEVLGNWHWLLDRLCQAGFATATGHRYILTLHRRAAPRRRRG